MFEIKIIRNVAKLCYTDMIPVTFIVTLTASLRAYSSSLLTCGPYILTRTAFRRIGHAGLSSAFFLHLLTPSHFKSFLVQFNRLISVFLLSLFHWFTQKCFLCGPTIRDSCQMASPFQSFYFIVATVFGVLYTTAPRHYC